MVSLRFVQVRLAPHTEVYIMRCNLEHTSTLLIRVQKIGFGQVEFHVVHG